MKADAELNLDSLLDAYLAKDHHKNDHEDLRDYHEKRFQILQELFGCDLETLPVKRSSRPLHTRRKATDKYSDGDSEAIPFHEQLCSAFELQQIAVSTGNLP